jgi:hypothetical protein
MLFSSAMTSKPRSVGMRERELLPFDLAIKLQSAHSHTIAPPSELQRRELRI